MKTLSFVDAMQALLDGNKIADVNWGKGVYICLNGDEIVDEEGDIIQFSSTSDDQFILYKEEKTKKLVTLYRPKVALKKDGGLTSYVPWYRTKEEAYTNNNNINTILEWEETTVEM